MEDGVAVRREEDRWEWGIGDRVRKVGGILHSGVVFSDWQRGSGVHGRYVVVGVL